MKKIILFAAFATVLFQSCSGLQGVPVSMEPIEHQFQVDKNKNDLYVSANNWMAETFNSAKSVIQFTDKEAGVVTGKYLLKPGYRYANYSYYETEEGSIYAIIKIQVKDGGTKITVSPDDFNEVTSDMAAEKFKYSRDVATNQINNLVASYEDYIKKDNSENW